MARRAGAQVTEGKDIEIKCPEAVDYLLGQSDLPGYLVNSLPELIEKEVDFELVAELLGQHRKPSDAVVDRLLEFIPSEKYLDDVSEVIDLQAFAGPLIKVLEQAGSKIKATNAASILKHDDLDQESVQRLRSLFNAKPTTELATCKSELAFEILVDQINLDRGTFLDLHNYTRKQNFSEREVASYVGDLWAQRHIGQFCATVAESDSKNIHDILKEFLRQSFEELAPAYINGKTLYIYAVDGKLTEQRLEDEQAFREKFREAQRITNIPEWAWIKPPKGSESRVRAPLHDHGYPIPSRSSSEAAGKKRKREPAGAISGHTTLHSRRGCRA